MSGTRHRSNLAMKFIAAGFITGITFMLLGGWMYFFGKESLEQWNNSGSFEHMTWRYALLIFAEFCHIVPEPDYAWLWGDTMIIFGATVTAITSLFWLFRKRKAPGNFENNR